MLFKTHIVSLLVVCWSVAAAVSRRFISDIITDAAKDSKTQRPAGFGMLHCEGDAILYRALDKEIFQWVSIPAVNQDRARVESILIGRHNIPACRARRYPTNSPASDQNAFAIVLPRGQQCGFTDQISVSYSNVAMITIYEPTSTGQFQRKTLTTPLICPSRSWNFQFWPTVNFVGVNEEMRREDIRCNVYGPGFVKVKQQSRHIAVYEVLQFHDNTGRCTTACSDEPADLVDQSDFHVGSSGADVIPIIHPVTVVSIQQFWPKIREGPLHNETLGVTLSAKSRTDSLEDFGGFGSTNVHIVTVELDDAFDDNYNMLGSRCWATPDANHENPISYQVIAPRGCNEMGPGFVEVTRIERRALEFTVAEFWFDAVPAGKVVYFHCDVNICTNADTSGHCTPSCSGSRAAPTRGGSRLLSSNPINRVPQSAKYHQSLIYEFRMNSNFRYIRRAAISLVRIRDEKQELDMTSIISFSTARA
ncbi:hypothetical protein BV898_15811 [Hypsibius exemplaris]|uniref:ZP domain-containing protein n=1 Tax=Hypsibius exemplaris TaxID=2072580 RepID=A0A9X6NKV2_HYPEX|nr:hypothetical protein BV898_15811 [Hypsibius exemplaris]